MASVNCLRCGCLISDFWTHCSTCRAAMAKERKEKAAVNGLVINGKPYNPIADSLGYWR
jgi:hypothetical protein